MPEQLIGLAANALPHHNTSVLQHSAKPKAVALVEISVAEILRLGCAARQGLLRDAVNTSM